MRINIITSRFEATGMPHNQDVEAANSPDAESTYECLQCGRLVSSETHPGTCECGGEFQNREKSLE